MSYAIFVRVVVYAKELHPKRTINAKASVVGVLHFMIYSTNPANHPKTSGLLNFRVATRPGNPMQEGQNSNPVGEVLADGLNGGGYPVCK